jgi:colicin import membrane protein
MTEVLELTELPPAETALQIYQTPNGLDPYIERIRQEVTGHAPNLKTDKGRKEIASRAFKVRKIKAALDGLGKEQVDRLKEIPKLIDAERKRMRDELDALADEVRKPLTDWEEAEASRVALHRAALDGMAEQAREVGGLDVETLRQRITIVESAVMGESWEEFEAEAHRVKAKALEILNSALAERQKYEAEQAELAELRRKQAEQEQKNRETEIARQAAEKARADAQAERDAAAKREADAKAAANRAEQERAEAIERQKQAEARAEAEKLAAEQRAKDAAESARQAEIKRQADEKAAEEAEQRRREEDKAHKASINNAALAAFIENGVPDECAKQAVILIAKGLIPAIRIQY